MYAVNPDTFAGYFAAIIKKYKELQPRAKFFLITMPREYRDDERKIGLKKAHRKLMYEFAERFDNVYVIDLYELAPPYDESFELRHVMERSSYALRLSADRRIHRPAYGQNHRRTYRRFPRRRFYRDFIAGIICLKRRTARLRL